ncbi:type II toxin-antitoxin system VapC family toxin [Tsukamurella sp. NPDC003166]|uniref:type II toxin-antitoxin system VapC family toxin n=1 Tax=Tsukamurella sp. NPDC003166 TaxID=3154444 RepID=UPI0033A50F84
MPRRPTHSCTSDQPAPSSERWNPQPTVERWLSGVNEQPVITPITRAEILSGIALLPRGERRAALHDAADEAFASFAPAIPFDHNSAEEYAAVLEIRKAAGRPISIQDAMIAAIARQSGAGLATRNVKDFEGLGLRLVDPWSSMI